MLEEDKPRGPCSVLQPKSSKACKHTLVCKVYVKKNSIMFFFIYLLGKRTEISVLCPKGCTHTGALLHQRVNDKAGRESLMAAGVSVTVSQIR